MQSTLKNLINQTDRMSYLIEAHDGISAKIVEKCGGEGIWASGFTISTACGVRDANELSWRDVLNILENIRFCTSIPILVDGDTGYGNFNNARIFVIKLCGLGISGVVFEDKVFPKINSFTDNNHVLAPIEEFCGKIKACKDAQTDSDFCVVARTEAFIAKQGLEEALNRARAYVNAGADAVVVHSKQNTPCEILNFCNSWKKKAPIIIIPTTYTIDSPASFVNKGVSCSIFANQLLRSAVRAMENTCKKLLSSCASKDIDMATISEIFDLMNMQELNEAELRYLGKREW